MKAFLILIFSVIHFYCFSQQVIQTHFTDLTEALKQPENVRSLELNYWNSNKTLHSNDLVVFKNLNNFFLRMPGSDFDYRKLFKSLSTLSFLDSLELDGCQLNVLPVEIGGVFSLKYLKITHCQLVVLSDEIKYLKNLEVIDLSSNLIDTLPNIFNAFVHLNKLDLSNNKISRLPESICSLINLEEFYLYHNQLISLPECIHRLKSLKRISLSANPLIRLPATFKQIALERIALGANNFHVFPNEIFNNISLKVVSINDVSLDSLPESITALGNLESIYLRSIHGFNWADACLKLSKLPNLKKVTLQSYTRELIPQEISQLNQISSLDIRGFSNFSDAIGFLSNNEHLTFLEIGRYDDTVLPSSIGKLIGLKVLKLEYCGIVSIPPEIGALTSLEELYITKYPGLPVSIPSEIGSLIKLKILDLTGCKISSLPNTICNLVELKTLKLFDNLLKELPACFSNLKELKELDLGRNKLETIPVEIGHLDNLIEIHLSYNQIKHLAFVIFESKSLETVWLNNNNVLSFDSADYEASNIIELFLHENLNLMVLPEFIGQLPKLNYLNIECTQIKSLPKSFLNNETFKEIVLSGNFFNNKKALNRRYRGVIEVTDECERLDYILKDYNRKYGKISTWLTMLDDTIQLNYVFMYDEPNSVDEEYTRNVILKINSKDLKVNQMIHIPDSLCYVFSSLTSFWRGYGYVDITGELTILKINKKCIWTSIDLSGKYSESSKPTKIIDDTSLIFRKRNKNPLQCTFRKGHEFF